MFFYRAWASTRDLNRPDDSFNDQLFKQFLYLRWIYGTLLLTTLLAGLVLNASVLLAFVRHAHLRALPHWAVFLLSLRDVMVCLVLVPVSVYWFVLDMGIWGGGDLLCKVAAFVDFVLAAEYPALLLAFGLVLFTRDFVQQEDALEQHLNALPQDEVDERIGTLALPAIVIQPPSSTSSPRPMTGPAASRPPSLPGSVGGRRGGGAAAARGRPGSASGSSDPRPMSGQRVRLTSPLSRLEESVSVSVGNASDLWEQASLDYPGRETPTRDFEADENLRLDSSTKEVRFNHWQRYLLLSTWLPALFAGLVASSMMSEQPRRRPGCFIPVDPFKNPYSYSIDDAGYNFHLIFVGLTYIFATAALLLLLLATCYWRMADSPFRCMVRLLVWLVVVYVVSRSPCDVQQLRALLDAGQGFNLRDPYEMEYEVLLVWTVFLPVVANPLLYITLVDEYREAMGNVCKWMFGCYKEEQEEMLDNKESNDNDRFVLKTEESDML